MYHTDFKTQERTLRSGSLVFRDVVLNWRKGNHLKEDEIGLLKKHKRGISNLSLPPVPLLLNQRAIMGSVGASVDNLDTISETSSKSPPRIRGRKK